MRTESTRWQAARPALRTSARLLVGVGSSAVATYVYLIVAARSLGPGDYATFSAFWAIAVIVGAGVYLPVEQETGRRAVGRPGFSGSVTRGSGTASWVAAGGLTVGLGLVLMVSWPLARLYFGDDAWLVVAVLFAGVGYAVQYPVRGLLSAGRRYGTYAGVLGTEAVLRVLLVGLAVVVVTDPGPALLAAVVGGAAAGSALAGLLRLRSAGDRSAEQGPDAGGAAAVLRSVAVLVTGAVALQTLLYLSVLVARVWAPAGQEEVAGRLLAAITVTRIPVFVLQSVESLVVPRIAERAASGDRPAVASTVRWLLLAVGVLAVTAVAGSALLGPLLVEIMFGSAFAVGHGTMALLGLGTGVFMLALAASDVSVALEGHRRMAVAWVLGLLAALGTALVVQDFLLRVTLPLVVGAAVSLVLLARAVWSRVAATTGVAVL